MVSSTSFTYILTDEEKEIIDSAKTLRKYIEAPVPKIFSEEFKPRLADFAKITYDARTRLSKIYPAGIDIESYLQADWEEAFAQGIYYMHDETSVSFPIHYTTSSGIPLDISIRRNHESHDLSGLLWFISYIPDLTRLQVAYSHPVFTTDTVQS
ncbi:hypothetical protein ACFQY8_05285 [Alloscardovia venturai]|uniref:Uncharacterized protein n=1 Tax=Alloscardovia venturai TaxID=1769421 RepID=A0ABW2Y4Z7_9BIFI